MAKRMGEREFTTENVLDAALRRIHEAYDRFDRLAVSFSGGKDSTVILNLVLQVARERNRLPLDVFFFDEEVVSPDTVDYVRRVSQIEDIRFRWLCLSLRGRNACSQAEPWWYYWAEEDRDRWYREPPPEGEFDLEGFDRSLFTHDLNNLIYPGQGSLGIFLGVRCQESLRRLQGVLSKKVDAWITKRDQRATSTQAARSDFLLKPIYDWTTEDVWKAPRELGWDYNISYDKMEMLGVSRFDQRIAPPFAQQPLKNLSMWAQIWPEVWDKMVARVPGVATAARLSRTLAYGEGRGFAKPTDGWRSYIATKLKNYPPDARRRLKKLVDDAIRQHVEYTNDPLPDEREHPISGISWKRIAKIVQKGNYRGRMAIRKLDGNKK